MKLILLAIGCILISASTEASELQPQRLLKFTLDTCHAWEATAAPASGYTTTPADKSEIVFRGTAVGTRYRLEVDDLGLVELEVIDRAGPETRFISRLFHESGDPEVLLSLDSECGLRVARRINYNEHGQALNIVTLDTELAPQGEPDWINPALDFIERQAKPLKHPTDATPLRVGMVDSGVNYRLPEINRQLARDADGHLVGYDFWDMDALPYDAHPVTTGFFLQRHGTRSASLLLREAPGIELVAYRYPRPDMSRMQALVEHADSNRVTILGMPLGSNRAQDWGSFARAARAHPQMLFIVSAGNDGRNIDEHPVYPAALDLDNMIVVTSADDTLRPAERTNWGKISVDYLIPAELQTALDYSGNEIRVSGSSYAVARVTALAARIQMAHRQWKATDIALELRNRYSYSNAHLRKWVGVGYIADPLVGAPISRHKLPDLELKLTQIDAGMRLPLDILVLDSRWSQQRIEQAVQLAFEILAQCDLLSGGISVHAISGDDYLRDLATGSARSLLEAAGAEHTTVVFARDTRMLEAFDGEAFGLGNTRTRPWLANSVWLMLGVDDAGIALAHELYHVLANSGAHVEGVANLMQARTRPESHALTTEQCRLAQVNGRANGLLQD